MARGVVQPPHHEPHHAAARPPAAGGREPGPADVRPAGTRLTRPTRPALRRAYARAMARGVTPAIYTQELFSTNHGEANCAAVAAVPADDLDLVGLAFRAERKTVERSSTRCATRTFPTMRPGRTGRRKLTVGVAVDRNWARSSVDGSLQSIAARGSKTRRIRPPLRAPPPSPARPRSSARAAPSPRCRGARLRPRRRA